MPPTASATACFASAASLVFFVTPTFRSFVPQDSCKPLTGATPHMGLVSHHLQLQLLRHLLLEGLQQAQRHRHDASDEGVLRIGFLRLRHARQSQEVGDAQFGQASKAKLTQGGDKSVTVVQASKAKLMALSNMW